MTVGEAVMTVALADSLFLSISPDAARGRVILFLALSLAPFAIVAPFIGPFVDRMRGGRRLVVILAASLRAVVSFLMIGRIDSLTLFPLAFAALVLSKTYSVSKSALVPTVVPEERELVDANSKLGLLSGLIGFAAAVPAAIIQLISPNFTLGLSGAAFIAAVVSAWHLPRDVRIAREPRSRAEIEELRSKRVRRAVAAMRLMRALVGLMFFHLAFWLRDQKAGTVWFGFAVSLAAIGTMTANWAAPSLRARMRTESMLLLSLVMIAAAGIGAGVSGVFIAGILLTAVVNSAAAIGRVAFESTVQAGAPDADKVGAFARFETHNQLAWVAGGLVPVVLSFDGHVGSWTIGLLGAVGAVVLLRDRRASRSRAGRARDRGRPAR